jgi:hypothetical protein
MQRLLAFAFLVSTMATASALNPEFQWNSPSDPYLVKLRNDYQLDNLVAGKSDDLERIQLVSNWVRSRWVHDPMNEAKVPDPISILEEASRGTHFRSTESAVVLSGALNALGIPARVVGLMRKDAETAESYSGHVVVEAYLRHNQKWIVVDAKWDCIPLLNGEPLNAVELRDALANGREGLSIKSLSGPTPEAFFDYINPLLYFFDTKLDSRFEPGKAPYDRHSGALMLIPAGAQEPKVFQRVWPLENMLFTHSVDLFYAAPRI